MTVVVDASAIMAVMLGEPGTEKVLAVVRRSLMSAINVSECCARGVERGASADEVLSIINSYEVQILSFELEDALAAAQLREPTRAIGASLGDRACLALGRRYELPVLTGDRRLAEIHPALGIAVRLIR